MTDSHSPKDEQRGRVRIAAVIASIGAVLAVAFLAHVAFFSDQLDTATGGAPPSTSSDVTKGRTAAAQQSAESTVGKHDPAGQEDATGGRARAIKSSSQPSSVSDAQREQVKQVISAQQGAPRQNQVDFEMMIGAAVPKQTGLQDIPPELTQILNGYWGSQYVLVQDKLVIVDQHSRRVVAIVPSVA